MKKFIKLKACDESCGSFIATNLKEISLNPPDDSLQSASSATVDYFGFQSYQFGQGHNKRRLDEPIFVPKGSVPYLEQIETGIVVLFSQAASNFSDLHINEKTNELKDLKSKVNWRFFLKIHLEVREGGGDVERTTTTTTTTEPTTTTTTTTTTTEPTTTSTTTLKPRLTMPSSTLRSKITTNKMNPLLIKLTTSTTKQSKKSTHLLTTRPTTTTTTTTASTSKRTTSTATTTPSTTVATTTLETTTQPKEMQRIYINVKPSYETSDFSTAYSSTTTIQSTTTTTTSIPELEYPITTTTTTAEAVHDVTTNVILDSKRKYKRSEVGHYILLNSYIKQDSVAIGFDIYMVQAGYIKIGVFILLFFFYFQINIKF